jgi:hypothetical protein
MLCDNHVPSFFWFAQKELLIAIPAVLYSGTKPNPDFYMQFQ